jgi:hypothetical protein
VDFFGLGRRKWGGVERGEKLKEDRPSYNKSKKAYFYSVKIYIFKR